MIVSEVFSAHLVTESGYDDITSGIINVDIQFGTDVYEGPYQQIDTGLFTIVSRGSILDPKINSNVVEGASIEFRDSRNVEEGKTNVFFLGYITDIDVQYQREDNPIITITGTDAFGLLQRTVVSENIKNFALGWSGGMEDTPEINGPSLTTLVSASAWQDFVPVGVNVIDPIVQPTVPGSIDPALPYNVYLGYNPARYLPDLGETLLEVLNKYTQTNLNYCSIDFRTAPNIIDVYPYAKYNAFFWPPIQDPSLEFPTYNFSSDPADGRPYESILINNGYNRRSQSLAISNETRLWSGITFDDPIVSTTTNYPPYKVNEDDTSVATNLDTIFATSYVDNDSIDLYAQDIFQVVNFGFDEIQQITFDNARFEDVQNDYTYSFSQLNQFIRIKHQLTENQTIDRFYDIAGITHNITPDKWEMGFTFKPAQNEIAFNYQGQLPTIQMNSLTGDSNFNFTATITDFPTEDISEVIWCLNGTNSNVNEQWLASAGTGELGSRYKDELQRNGLTQTWNFDDDGILKGPEFPTGGYGTGEWYVIPYIILNNGWVIAPHVMLTVGTPSVEADFTWSQNLTNNFGQVTFTDQSHNNEVGEVDSYFWNFGDGTTSALQNPVHQYDPSPSTTTYSVSLTVFAYGEDEEKIYNTHTETVTLVQPAMTANFTSTQTVNTGIVTFTNTSVNVGYEEPDAYLWNFGDGTTSTLKNPVHTFVSTENVPITYSVSLTTRNIWEQTASVTKSVTVLSLNDAGSLPVNNLRLTVDNFDTVTPSPNVPLYPYMIFLRARTSYTQANLIYLAPTSRTGTTSNIVWYEADGTTAESGDPYNLTRDPSITPTNQYGLSPWINNTTTESTKWVLNTSLSNSQNIKNIQMTLRDVDGSGSGGRSQNAIVNVDVPDSFGGYVNIGYFKVPSGKINPNAPYGVVSEGLKTMIPRRPMPPNIPYFKYTFDNLTASFESMETADSYAWTFGDGTTSTVKNPTKTFPRRGTYTVTLAVTNGGIVTRTTTEPVIVEAIAPFDVRYVKFEQNEHDGTHAFDTPFLTNFTMRNIQDSLNTHIVYTPGPPYEALEISKTVAKQDFYSMQYTPGDGSFSFNPTTNPYSFWLTSSSGLRAKSLDAGFLTKWNLICDFRKAWKNVADFTVDVALANISPNPTVASGISYSVYVTNHTGSTIDPNAVTWTKVGDITPTAMTQLAKTYSIVPS